MHMSLVLGHPRSCLLSPFKSSTLKSFDWKNPLMNYQDQQSGGHYHLSFFECILNE